ncbi:MULTISPECIES: hypothetical protein [Phaeobacter]|uniref:hypothetical protein n=1 Tax=Phaeobacter TaxID=302485 RepID=UPI00058C2A65|nr:MULTISPECIES: hypothetical protein [Phaeobacter]ATG38975.1 hypothetical protein PhaeoP14_00861 [Phaeobacter piscinae]AXT33560.1 hypothetical protein D1820_00470 [Phaeobacter sp. LSS9]UTS79938.1 hypothetical protein OL67_000995 [Phaeobacter piscinae]
MTLLSTPLRDRLGTSLDDRLDTLRILGLTVAICLAIGVKLTAGGQAAGLHSAEAPVMQPPAIETQALI